MISHVEVMQVLMVHDFTYGSDVKLSVMWRNMHDFTCGSDASSV